MGRMTRIEIPGPRFLKLGPGENWDANQTAGCQVYVQIECDPKNITANIQALDEAKAGGLIVGGSVIPDKVKVRTAARQAATLARSADTLDEAVAAYVGKMPLAEGVDRDEVLNMVRGYLAQSGG